MVVVGTDVHKRTHTFVAVDEVGCKLGEKVVAATTGGHQKALSWARVASSVRTCAGVSRTVVTYRPGWSVICSRRVNRWCGWRPN